MMPTTFVDSDKVYVIFVNDFKLSYCFFFVTKTFQSEVFVIIKNKAFSEVQFKLTIVGMQLRSRCLSSILTIQSLSNLFV